MIDLNINNIRRIININMRLFFEMNWHIQKTLLKYFLLSHEVTSFHIAFIMDNAIEIEILEETLANKYEISSF